jgi:hypothetical protein
VDSPGRRRRSANDAHRRERGDKPPPEEVFDYVADPENLPGWSSLVLEVQKETQGELREGDRYTSVAKFLGPQVRDAHAGDGPRASPTSLRQEHGRPVRAGVHVRLGGTTAGGTRLTQAAEGEPGGFFRLVGPLLEVAGRRQFKTDLANLKDLLEARS